MNGDNALAILRDANPVPDAAAFADDVLGARRLRPTAFLYETQERTMTQTIDDRPTEARPRRPWWQPALAAAAVIIVAAVAVVVITSGDDDVANVPAPPFATAEEAVRAYVANGNSPDWDDYLAMLAPTITDNHWNTFKPGRGEDRARLAYEGLEAEVELLDARLEFVDCPAETERLVACTIIETGGLHNEAGTLERTVTLTLAISDDGYIERVSSTWDLAGTPPGAEYADWLEANHPSLVDEWINGVQGDVPLTRPVPEIVADLWEVEQEFFATR